MPRKFQFVIPDDIRALLEDLRVRTGRENLSTVIKDALKVYNWVVQEYEKGNEVISNVDPNASRRFTLLSFLNKEVK
jgi:hypothetical protein